MNSIKVHNVLTISAVIKFTDLLLRQLPKVDVSDSKTEVAK